MNADLEHRCGAGRNCRAAVIEDGNREPATITEPEGLCDKCRTAVQWAINDMTDTWLGLHVSIGDRARRAGQRVTGSKSAPINLNTDVDALKVAIVEWMVAAAAPIAERMNIDDPQPRNNSDTEHARVLLATSRILATRIDDLITAPPDDVTIWLTASDTAYPGERLYIDEHGTPHNGTAVHSMTGVDIALKLVDLRRAARSLLALTTPHDKLSFPCPHCNDYELVRSHHTIRLAADKTKDVDQIDCGNCNLSWPYERYQQLCLIWVREDEMEREKLQKQLETEKERRELAEWLLAKREWQLGLALDCTDVSASAYAATILAAG